MQSIWDIIANWGYAIWDFFGDADNRDRSTAIATVFGAIIVLSAALWAILKFAVSPLLKPKPQTGAVSPNLGSDHNVLTKETLRELLEGRIAKRVAKMEAAHGDEKAELLAQIADLRHQRQNPDKALEDALALNADLEVALERLGNEVGGDKLADARAALQAGDSTLADELFAEVEAREALAVKTSARAAFARGEIAEGEVRWRDAAGHYVRAAQLAPSFETLFKARQFCWRAGEHEKALTLGADLLKAAEAGQDQIQISTALNEHALTLDAAGRHTEAEALFREALAIIEKTLGKVHPNYASSLNNLALLLHATGNMAEAELLFREALAITEKTQGKAHPDYARSLNNLAALLQAIGNMIEAEPLHREALAITEKTLGKAHPNYASGLSNIAVMYARMQRFAEAIPLIEQALEIREAALGPEHPDTIGSRASLAAMRVDAEG